MAPARGLTARQKERRRRIFESARRLVAEHGYDAVSMRAIAAASGTVEKTLFNIFGSKDRLLAGAAFDRSASVFALADKHAPGPGWPWLIALCNEIAELTLEYPQMTQALTVPLLDHFELVGLDSLYDLHVSAAMRVMAETGWLVPSARLPG